jgi:hypothetical protein
VSAALTGVYLTTQTEVLPQDRLLMVLEQAFLLALQGDAKYVQVLIMHDRIHKRKFVVEQCKGCISIAGVICVWDSKALKALSK